MMAEITSMLFCHCLRALKLDAMAEIPPSSLVTTLVLLEIYVDVP